VGVSPLDNDEILLARCKDEHQSFQRLVSFGFYLIADLLDLEKV